MSGFFVAILVVQIVSAIAIICLTLLQHGKGADMGAAFGSGSAGSVFGSSGSANFLSRMTSAAATLFFTSTLALAYISSQSNIKPSSVFDGTDMPVETTPATIPNIPTTQTVPASTPTQGVDQIPTN